MLNMVKGHHLQPKCHPPIFLNFRQFNMMSARAHHPFIYEEVDELLAKDAIGPSTGDAGFYSNVSILNNFIATCTTYFFKLPTV